MLNAHVLIWVDEMDNILEIDGVFLDEENANYALFSRSKAGRIGRRLAMKVLPYADLNLQSPKYELETN